MNDAPRIKLRPQDNEDALSSPQCKNCKHRRSSHFDDLEWYRGCDGGITPYGKQYYCKCPGFVEYTRRWPKRYPNKV